MTGLQHLWERWAGVPFQFGTFDCAILAAWWMDARVGSSHLEWLKVLGYHDGRSAVRLVRAAGGLRTAVVQRLGEPLPASQLQAGDIGLVHMGHNDRVEVLSIIAPQQVLMTSPKNGLIALPLRHSIAEGWPCRKP